MYRLSPASNQLPEICEGDRWHVLGDKAYPLLPHLITPYRQDERISAKHSNFNYCHAATRVVIENAFGLLKQRFRQLSLLDFHDVDKITKCVMSCCVLHNLCLSEGDSEEFGGEETDEDSQEDLHSEAPYSENASGLRRQGKIKRDNLASSLTRMSRSSVV